MNEHSITSQPPMPIPADNPQRPLKVAKPDTDQSLPHISLVGDTYTVLLSGNDTNGRYCLIDMHIPPGGYGYQDRAKELTAQLTRKDSADNVSLPTLPVWWVLQAFLSRDQQITYLAKRLKLLHTAQDMQPGDVYYDSVMPYSLTGLYCINPYLELKRMNLVSHDFVALAPFAADRDYMRTYSYFRDFHPSRTLHRVCWAVAELVNDTAIPPATRYSANQVIIPQALKDSYAPSSAKNEILSQAADGSIYFTAKPDGNVVDELRNWAQAQPPRGFIATWWQTPTALLISYLVYLRWRYLRAHPKPPRRSLFSRWRKKPTRAC